MASKTDNKKEKAAEKVAKKFEKARKLLEECRALSEKHNLEFDFPYMSEDGYKFADNYTSWNASSVNC